MQASETSTALTGQVSADPAVPAGRTWLAQAGRLSVGYVTVFLLLAALAVGIWGLSVKTRGVDFHLIVETIAVAAALTGVYAERIATRVERRHAAVRAVREELEDNIALLEGDPRFEPQNVGQPEPRIYPRLAVAAAESCLAQAALTDDGDAQRADELAQWREKAGTFNRTLGVIELVCYGVGFADHDAPKVITAADQELQEERGKMVLESRKVLSLI